MTTNQRLTLVLVGGVLALAAGVTWIWKGSDTPGLAFDPTASPSLAVEPVHTTRDDGEELAESRAAPFVDPVASSVSDGAALGPVDRRVALDSAAQPIGAQTFADLVSIHEGLDGPTLATFEVLCLASDGSLRVAASDALVLTSDLDSQGLLVLRAPGMCPRWLDPAVLSERLAAGETEPLRLMLFPSASVVMHAAPAPTGAAPITRLEVRSGGHHQLLDAFLMPELTDDANALGIYDRFANEASQWRALVDEQLAADVRAELLRACRGSTSLRWIAAEVTPKSIRFLLPWVAQLETAGAAVGATFNSVPAGVRIALHAISEDVLDHDGALDGLKRRQQKVGGCAMGPIVLRPGEVRVWNVHYTRMGSMSGRLPPGVVAGYELQLFLVDTWNDGGATNMIGNSLRADAATGVFVADQLLPGHYQLTARWSTTGSRVNGCTRDLDVAPGENVDLGELVAEANELRVVARVTVEETTVAAGTAIDVGELVCLARIANEQMYGSASETFLWLVPGEPFTLQGLPSGTLQVEPLAVCPRAEAAISAADYAARHGMLSNDQARDEGPLLLTGARGARRVELPGSGELVLDFEVAAVAQLDFDVAVPKLFARAGAVTFSWLVRGTGPDVHKQRLVTWRGEPSGGGFLSGTATLPAGEWTFIVQLTLPPTSEAPLVAIGRATVVLSPGDRRMITLELVEAATIHFGSQARPRSGLGADLGLVELPDWEYTPFLVLVTEGGALATGLLPDTEYQTSLERGERVTVRTGAPGSTVEVE